MPEIIAPGKARSLLEQLPEIVRAGKAEAEKILDGLEGRSRIALQTRELVAPAKDRKESGLGLTQRRGGAEVAGDWCNRLVYGDNLLAMAALLAGDEFTPSLRGKIDLIYIDPPFDSKADYRTKITLPGPFTLSRQVQNDFYKDEEELAMDYAIAVNQELKALKATGVDVVQLDEPWVRTAPEQAIRYGIKAINRALEGIEGPTVVHVCFGYAAVVSEKPSGYGFLAELGDTIAQQISIEAAQPRLDLGVLRDLAASVLPLPKTRQGAGLRHEISSPRHRLRQAEGACRRRCDCAAGTRLGRKRPQHSRAGNPAHSEGGFGDGRVAQQTKRRADPAAFAGNAGCDRGDFVPGGIDRLGVAVDQCALVVAQRVAEQSWCHGFIISG